MRVQVSTECDANLSYDTQATIDKVSEIINTGTLYICALLGCQFELRTRAMQVSSLLCLVVVTAGLKDHGSLLKEGH